MGLIQPVQSTAEPLLREQPYQDDPAHKDRIEWVKSRKAEYYDSSAFKGYKKRNERIKALVNQAWEPGKKATKFGFRFGIARAARDNYVEAFTDLYDLDEFLTFTSLKKDKTLQVMAGHLENYGNNLLQTTKYKRQWWERIQYFPDYGWSPAYADFVYQNGWKPKISVDAQTPGGLLWQREWTTVLSEARSMALHPYNWFGNPNSSYTHDRQGHTVRWRIPDLMNAKLKVDAQQKPLYNHKALDLLIAKLAKRESMADPYFTLAGDRDMVKASASDTSGVIPFVDITIYTGTLQGCKGHEDDDTTYIKETCGEYMLRFAEDTLSGLFPAYTHARTHPFRNSPFSQSFLDPIVPHQSTNDLLINLALENQIDAMHRMYAFYGDDLVDENQLLHPRGTSSFLEMTDRNAMVPKLLDNQRSGSLADMQAIREMLEQDRQRVGTPDQEIGIPGNGQGDTATQANILKSASTKKVRACAKRVSEDALVPECRSLILLSLMHSTPDKLRMTSRDGEIIQLTPEHIQLFVTGLDARVNDNVTRDKWEEASRKAMFWGNAFKVLQGLTQPEYAIRMVRANAKDAGFKADEIDDILPEPAIPELAPAPAMGAPTGAPPGGPGAAFPPAAPPALPPPEIGAPDVALQEA